MYLFDLSTSEIQSDALSFYRNTGYGLVCEESVETENNKTIGGGIRRYYAISPRTSKVRLGIGFYGTAR
jgi:hypothetical protein